MTQLLVSDFIFDVNKHKQNQNQNKTVLSIIIVEEGKAFIPVKSQKNVAPKASSLKQQGKCY